MAALRRRRRPSPASLLTRTAGFTPRDARAFSPAALPSWLPGGGGPHQAARPRQTWLTAAGTGPQPGSGVLALTLPAPPLPRGPDAGPRLREPAGSTPPPPHRSSRPAPPPPSLPQKRPAGQRSSRRGTRDHARPALQAEGTRDVRALTRGLPGPCPPTWGPTAA